ncbi:MAG: hypothetical protein KC776_34050 [Myxococcales bacterium]|nr:hypothetical protein [Myxococcales bacterium]
MSLDRIRHLVTRFRTTFAGALPSAPSPWDLDARLGRELLESMLAARHLDLWAHELRARGAGHYTICSSGHEANVVLGRLTGPDDPSLLHYRSGALVVERARALPSVDAVRDIALSLVASSDEPTSGGRHKVFGSKPLGIIPKTSTIGSHLPRAVGLAFGLERRPRLGLAAESPRDAIAVASFGDASLNHSTTLGALNAAGWVLHQRLTLPLLLVCEDNGLGISVRTPEGWIETRLRALPHVAYFSAPGWDLAATFRAAQAAVTHVRQKRTAAALHLSCVRLLGHAGSDVDTGYRPPAEIAAAEERDPLVCAALSLVDGGAMTAKEVLELDAAVGERVAREAERAVTRPRLGSRAEVMDAIVSPTLSHVPQRQPNSAPLTLAQGINAALAEGLEHHPEMLIFGEDVAKKGGVYGITKGLLAKGGPARVFNTLLDEQTILGIALGTANLGLLPVPEIQYLAYLHNAEDQLRGEAATMQFFSARQWDNPMVVRIPGLAYQKGFGGHFHNDNSIAVLRDVPGIVVMVPARGDDALELYRAAFALARQARRVVVVVEPIALYHTRDLHSEGDTLWTASGTGQAAAFGKPRVYDAEAPDLTIATYGNGVLMSLRAARRLSEERGARVRVLDLRFLAPLPVEEVLDHARQTGALLVVDECRRSAGVSEALATAALEHAPGVRFARVTGADCFIPLGDAANLVLLNEDEIFAAAEDLLTLTRNLRRRAQ